MGRTRQVDAVLRSIGALPGEARYAVTFGRADGTEQTAVMTVRDDTVEVAPASLPAGWGSASPAFTALARVLLAFDDARRHAPVGATLRDVAGGWDVSLGNVVLNADGLPTCTAHGPMSMDAAGYLCPLCQARAVLG